MGKQPNVRTQIVTVKSMPIDAWEQARSAALRSGETMAEWLTRAIRQLAEGERGDRVIPPGQPSQTTPAAAPPAVAAADLAALMQGLAAMVAATGVPVPGRTARGIYAATRTLVSPPGKLGSRIGQTGLLAAPDQPA